MKRVKNQHMQPSFSSYDLERRSIKTSVFYNQLNMLVDWSQIEKEINRYYKKGETPFGAGPYSGLLLFKMLLLGIWNNLSDVQVEMHVNDSLSASRFCGLSLEDAVPDHSTLSRFRGELTINGGMDKLLSAINRELSKHQLIVSHGIKVDASLTESPRKPNGKITYEIAEDRHEDDITDDEEREQITLLKKQQGKGVDSEGRWLRKGSKSIFGFKHHDAVDDNGLILAVHTTMANEHDSRGLSPLLEKLPEGKLEGGVLADKGYQVPANNILLKERGVKNRLMHKAYRNRPLTHWQVVFNKLISKSRWVVERTFGSINKWFNGGKARYVGLQKTHTQHVLQAIAYNLKRSPGIAMSNSIK